jgi:Ca2+-binding EF-hand superfamily protein
MTGHRFFIAASLLISSLSMAILPATFATKSFAAPSALAALDKDHDGTLDLAEVKDGANALFDKLDKNHDGTVNRKEAAGRLTKSEFKEADTDHDGTLGKDEYLAFVEKLNKDGTLDAKELRSKAGADTIEAQLAHVEKNSVRRAYHRQIIGVSGFR